MKTRNVEIALTVKNNLSTKANITLMGNMSSPGDGQINATTYWEWDLTPESFAGMTTVTLQARTTTSGPYASYTVPLATGSYSGVAIALSSLGMGAFLNNGPLIFTYNEDIEFDDIIIA